MITVFKGHIVDGKSTDLFDNPTMIIANVSDPNKDTICVVDERRRIIYEIDPAESKLSIVCKLHYDVKYRGFLMRGSRFFLFENSYVNVFQKGAGERTQFKQYAIPPNLPATVSRDGMLIFCIDQSKMEILTVDITSRPRAPKIIKIVGSIVSPILKFVYDTYNNIFWIMCSTFIYTLQYVNDTTFALNPVLIESHRNFVTMSEPNDRYGVYFYDRRNLTIINISINDKTGRAEVLDKSITTLIDCSEFAFTKTAIFSILRKFNATTSKTRVYMGPNPLFVAMPKLLSEFGLETKVNGVLDSVPFNNIKYACTGINSGMGATDKYSIFYYNANGDIGICDSCTGKTKRLGCVPGAMNMVAMQNFLLLGVRHQSSTFTMIFFDGVTGITGYESYSMPAELVSRMPANSKSVVYTIGSDIFVYDSQTQESRQLCHLDIRSSVLGITVHFLTNRITVCIDNDLYLTLNNGKVETKFKVENSGHSLIAGLWEDREVFYYCTDAGLHMLVGEVGILLVPNVHLYEMSYSNNCIYGISATNRSDIIRISL
jgi:hypothetical protein